MTAKPTSSWLVPALLLLLGALNVASGAFQLGALQQGPPTGGVPDDFGSMHHFETPLPILLHIMSGTLFNLLGPLQFVPAIRRRWPRCHRWSGRLLIVSGFLAALAALWMNQHFPLFGGTLKYAGVVLFSIGLMVSLAVGLRAILGRDVERHRAWMMRAIAIGLGPATQRLLVIPVFVIYGEVNELTIGLVVWFGFLVNLSVVEWILWRERRSGLWQLNTNLKGAQ